MAEVCVDEYSCIHVGSKKKCLLTHDRKPEWRNHN